MASAPRSEALYFSQYCAKFSAGIRHVSFVSNDLSNTQEEVGLWISQHTETWHGGLVYYPYETDFPRDTCSYWLRLSLSPAKWVGVAILWAYAWGMLTIIALIRLLAHWLFAPFFLGKYVLLTRYKGDIHCARERLSLRCVFRYFNEGLFSSIDDGYRVDGIIPFTRIKPFVWAMLGWLLWMTFRHGQPIFRHAAVIPLPMLAGGVAAIILSFAVILLVKTNSARLREAWEVLHGKICHKIPIGTETTEMVKNDWR